MRVTYWMFDGVVSVCGGASDLVMSRDIISLQHPSWMGIGGF